ncbi:MAG TPA: hypothetical protein DEA22_02875 [Blastocatellia bacterium]|nr:hypothetical protein [Blastocatellia bacterium]
MKKLLPAVCLVLLFSVSESAAQGVYSPSRGSAERKAILGALRIPVEKELKQRIVFVAQHFSVLGNWAYVGGIPQTPEGRRPNLKNTVYAEADEAGIFDDNFSGLLRKTGGKWKVVTFALGCTDVCYADWWRRFKAPKAIFPYTE